jgi:GMP synthase (glutamine-hydrolysing)
MRVLAVTHGPSVGPGVFADAVQEAGHELVEWPVQLGGRAPEGADAVIVLGGAMHPDEDERHGWLTTELRWLEGLLDRGTPLLGICLGSQLVARAAGAEVFRSSESEVGWFAVERTAAAADDPVAGALPERFDAFEWHHYTHSLPDGAVELARSRLCMQAFRLGNAWGVQFHPEVRAEQVEAWVGEDPEDVSNPEDFIAAMRARIADWNELGRGLCRAFLAAA